ncbi:hypothetical protein IH922_09320 [candidate division KSB1 bacterium]|nr:hypothetical protein [candidate division KSB1 bacterium]
MMNNHENTRPQNDAADNGIVKTAWAWFTRILHERIIVLPAVIFCTGAVILLWYVFHLQTELVDSTALENAALYPQALQELLTP